MKTHSQPRGAARAGEDSTHPYRGTSLLGDAHPTPPALAATGLRVRTGTRSPAAASDPLPDRRNHADPSATAQPDPQRESRALQAALLFSLRFIVGLALLEQWLIGFPGPSEINRLPLVLLTLMMVLHTGVDFAACWQASWNTRCGCRSERWLGRITRTAVILAPFLLIAATTGRGNTLESPLILLMIPLAATRWLAAAHLIRIRTRNLLKPTFSRSLSIPLLLTAIWLTTTGLQIVVPAWIAQDLQSLAVMNRLANVAITGWLVFSAGMACWFAAYAIALMRTGVSATIHDDAW